MGFYESFISLIVIALSLERYGSPVWRGTGGSESVIQCTGMSCSTFYPSIHGCESGNGTYPRQLYVKMWDNDVRSNIAHFSKRILLHRRMTAVYADDASTAVP